MAEKIVTLAFEDAMSQSYIDYSMSVITERALPDIRDGLKPVQRRVLFSLSSLAPSDKPHRKCARIVGDTMGKFHPHGDSSIYEALVNLAQEWKGLPLIEPHGNFGSVSGDHAAAMRYTEARLSSLAYEMGVKNLKFYKESFIPNFDNTEEEPTFLPFILPNILLSGSTGIAVGMATSIPTHNLSELIRATCYYLEQKYAKNKEVCLDALMKYLPAPDFETGGIINASQEELRSLYESGKGKIKVRGKVEIRDIGYGKKSICITELPVTMIGQTEAFLDSVKNLVLNRQLPQVTDIADRGDKDGECLCIDVKKGTTPEQIEQMLAVLYKKTKLEDNLSVNMNVLVSGSPKVLGLLDIFHFFSEFLWENYRVRYEKLLAEQKSSFEIKSGLILAVDMIDLIIQILRGASSDTDVKACLTKGEVKNIKFKTKSAMDKAKKLSFTEAQANAILSMRLRRLIGLEIKALKAELAECKKNIAAYEKLLVDDVSMTKQIIVDIKALDKFASPRKTEILNLGEVKLQQAQPEDFEVVCLVDRFFYAKVIDVQTYEKNKDDIAQSYIACVTTQSSDRICLLTQGANCYTVKITDIIKQQQKNNQANKKKKSSGIFGKLSDKGVCIYNEFESDGNVLSVCASSELETKTVLVVSEQGFAKRIKPGTISSTRKVCAFSTERLCFAGFAEESEQIATCDNSGHFARFSVKEIPYKGKSASGVKLYQDKVLVCACEVGDSKSVITVKEHPVPFAKIKLFQHPVKGVKLRL